MHHCSNAKCKKISYRDECGRGIFVLAAIRAARSRTSSTDVTGTPGEAIGSSTIAVSDFCVFANFGSKTVIFEFGN